MYLVIDQNNKILQTSFSELTDSHWQVIDKVIDDQRKRKHSLPTIINAIFSLNNSGVQRRNAAQRNAAQRNAAQRNAAQRNLDSKYPAWQTVFYHFTQFKERGIWENILSSVVDNERKRRGKSDTPRLLAIDSQSVKKVQFTNEETGIDGGKNINGRKRTILVNSLGLAWSIKVTAANISDNQAGILAVDKNIIKRMLLECISLRGICRVMLISKTWLLAYIKELYSELPKDLNFSWVFKKVFHKGKFYIKMIQNEADELWSFVQNKDNTQYVWIVMQRESRQIICFQVGDRIGPPKRC